MKTILDAALISWGLFFVGFVILVSTGVWA
jgi:hypothetical protein